MSPRLRMVALAANSILKQCHTDPNTPPPQVSAHWAERWRDRNPTWFKRRQKPQELSRAVAEELGDLTSWYEKYHAICEEHGIQPSDIWNMDESSFRVGIAKAKYVLTECPNREARLLNSTNRESLTVIEAISAGGEKIPPMLVLTSKRHMGSWYKYLHDDTLVGVLESGYTNDQLALCWVEHFNEFSRRTMTGSRRLLIIDNHGSHCTKEFINYCDNNLIIPFGLPSHATAVLQPLDVVVFQPYKHYHGEAVD